MQRWKFSRKEAQAWGWRWRCEGERWGGSGMSWVFISERIIFIIFKIRMKLLSQSTIKETELALMQQINIPSPLPQTQPTFQGFKPFIPTIKNSELQKLGVEECLTLDQAPTAPLQAFSWALLRTIFTPQLKQDILNILKSIIFACELTPLLQQHSSQAPVSAEYPLWVMVNFLQSIEYGCINGKVELNLLKDRVTMDLMVFYLQALHKQLNENVETSAEEMFQDFIDYFDLNCRRENSLFLFYEEQIFLQVISKNQIVFGEYSPNKKTRLNRSIMKQSIQIGRIQYPRFLGIQHISDSVIFEVDAGTPSFKIDDSEASFHSSGISEGSNLKNSREVNQRFGTQSLMKTQDRNLDMKKSKGLFGSMAEGKRRSLERKVAKVYQNTFDKIMDSPQTTYNTPKTAMHESLFFQAHQTQINRSAICSLQKSQSLKDMHVKEEKSQELSDSCGCHRSKKEKNRLFSNIYDINVTVVSDGNEKFLSNKNLKILVVSKGINFEIFCKAPEIQAKVYPKTISSYQVLSPSTSSKSFSPIKANRVKNTKQTNDKKMLKVPAFLKKKIEQQR